MRVLVVEDDCYDAQQYDGPANPHRPNNLWHPVPGSYGAHCQFDDRSRDWSPELWATIHASTLAVGVTALAGLVYLALGGSQRFSWLEQLMGRPSHREPTKLLMRRPGKRTRAA